MAGRRSYGTAGAAFANAASSVLGFQIEQQAKSSEEERKARNDFASRAAEAMIQYQGATPQEAYGAFQTLRGVAPSMQGGLAGQGMPPGLAQGLTGAGVMQQHLQASQPGPMHPVMSDEEYRRAGYKSVHEYEYYPSGRMKGMKKNYTYTPQKLMSPADAAQKQALADLRETQRQRLGQGLIARQFPLPATVASRMTPQHQQAIGARISQLRNQGVSEDIIAQFLIEKGLDPSVYGVGREIQSENPALEQ